MQDVANELARYLQKIRELGKFAQATQPNCVTFPVLAEPNKAPPTGIKFYTGRSGEAVVTIVVDCTQHPPRNDPRSK